MARVTSARHRRLDAATAVTPPRTRSRLPGSPWLVTLAAFGALLGGACDLHQQGVTPPDNRIFFPSGGIVDVKGRWLYVVNSNSDLRYNAGTIVAVDLDKVRADMPQPGEGRDKWPDCTSEPRYAPPANAPHQCCWDYLDPNALNCDEQDDIARDRTVRIGSFGGRPVVQDLTAYDGANPDAAPAQRMFVPVRGDNSITMLDLDVADDGPRLTCTGERQSPNTDQATFAACEDAWRIRRKDDPVVSPNSVDIPDSDVLTLPDEPFALALDQKYALLYVGHLSNGAVSLIDLGRAQDSDYPNLVSVANGLLPPDASGLRGVTSLGIAEPPESRSCPPVVFMASRYLPVVGSFVVFGLNSPDGPCGVPTTANASRDLALVGGSESLSTGIPGTETRGVAFIGSDRAYVLQKTPPALVGVDRTSTLPFGVAEVCQNPTNLVLQSQGLDGPMLFVTCFDAGEVYVVDPTSLSVRAIIPVSRGPASTIFDPTDPTRAYVIGFGANNVSVIDLDPQSATQYRVIQRVGFPTPTPREVAQ